MLMLQTACFCPSMWLPAATANRGILSVGDGLLDCNYSTWLCFSPYHQPYHTLLVCGFPTETLATYWLKVVHFNEVRLLHATEVCGTKAIMIFTAKPTARGLHSFSLSLSLSQQGVNVTKMENFLLQENGYWPNKVIISSTPHATHTCQEDGFHACRRMLVWLATGTGLS